MEFTEKLKMMKKGEIGEYLSAVFLLREPWAQGQLRIVAASLLAGMFAHSILENTTIGDIALLIALFCFTQVAARFFTQWKGMHQAYQKALKAQGGMTSEEMHVTLDEFQLTMDYDGKEQIRIVYGSVEFLTETPHFFLIEARDNVYTLRKNLEPALERELRKILEKKVGLKFARYVRLVAIALCVGLLVGGAVFAIGYFRLETPEPVLAVLSGCAVALISLLFKVGVGTVAQSGETEN